MSEWTLDILVRRLDECVAREAPQKGKEFENFDSLTPEEQKRLLLETADRFFNDGRYSIKTEWSIEMYELPQANAALVDLKQINALDEKLRKHLTFYQHFVKLCFPLFRKKEIDVTEAPLCFKSGVYDISNKELRDFLYNTDYIYLARVIAEGLLECFVDVDKNTVAFNTLNQQEFYGRPYKKTSKEKYRTDLDSLIDALWDAYNHIELGRRMGLTDFSQSLYDMTDGFLCKYYDYRQVDYAKELEQWFEDNESFYGKKLTQEQVDRIANAVKTIAQKHEVVFADLDHTLNCIFLDLLRVPFPDEDDNDDDNEDDDEDDNDDFDLG